MQNVSLVWKPDSTAIVVVTSGGYRLFYGLRTGSKNLFEQVDPESHKLRRESHELFLKEPIPAITIQLIL
ncbi:unnamed protein product [Allacma fusca]|uniref:Uncharacterized protein n=1 Tax=Allacma fusca TaxID=39272 RepID=A0A8J2JYA1_9HEXA|nr:unnamed protein product [Allacma fusca]